VHFQAAFALMAHRSCSPSIGRTRYFDPVVLVKVDRETGENLLCIDMGYFWSWRLASRS